MFLVSRERLQEDSNATIAIYPQLSAVIVFCWFSCLLCRIMEHDSAATFARMVKNVNLEAYMPAFEACTWTTMKRFAYATVPDPKRHVKLG